MSISIEQRNKTVRDLLNGTFTSFKNVIPIQHETKKPQLLGKSLHLQYGVLIGITGDIKGNIILSSNPGVFGSIGEVMFGMSLEGDMLASFSGELGNMIAGSLSTIIVENGLKTDITSPTIMEGNTTLSGYDKAIQLTIVLEEIGEMDIYLLID
ncbi:chemotaxis protein CheX [Lederbergia wuyishanensis]|uniref:Chemotaxis protein CheX n=1 Tax=Lederbergia wuyishanensis TaxID=1347903 RepID=A0ABU0D8Q9_9BACI|nr:chemotaxis protein CheX [Lederbergia wuyishanensis]MCJ8007617.1 chemotaxis protein CheX [Lederbergia wuyishanensis]MDQ0344799.1 chemotaxis protein CheX [Lederbergia wuyishanensis]